MRKRNTVSYEDMRNIDDTLYHLCRLENKNYKPMFNTHEKIRRFNRFVVGLEGWGVIIPCESGVCFEIQTMGVCCHHVTIEGVFVSLNKPYCKNKRHKHATNEYQWKEDKTDLLAALQQANYHNNGTKKSCELVDKLWREIKEVMHFDFEIIDIETDSKEPMNQEGILWIKFTKFEDGWGHGEWVKKLIGKKLVLVYPNCD